MNAPGAIVMRGRRDDRDPDVEGLSRYVAARGSVAAPTVVHAGRGRLAALLRWAGTERRDAATVAPRGTVPAGDAARALPGARLEVLVEGAWRSCIVDGRPAPAIVEDGTADAIACAGTLESLPLDAGIALAGALWRALRPGGVLRVTVPDVEAFLRSYSGNRRFIARQRPGRPTALLALQEVLHGGGGTLYDFETLELVLRAAGFRRIEQRAHGLSRITPCPDGEPGGVELLFVEAVRD